MKQLLEIGFARGAMVLLVALAVVGGAGLTRSSSTSAQESSGLYRVMKTTNVRTKPNTEASVIVELPRYVIVSVVGAKGCGAHSCAWYKADFDGHRGWVKGTKVEPALPIAGTAAANDALNLRATPGYDGEILRVLPDGGAVTLTGKQSYPWVSVSDKGTKGWVFAEYLTVYPPGQP